MNTHYSSNHENTEHYKNRNSNNPPTNNTACDVDAIYGSVFDFAMEATNHIIDPDVRDSLDDSDFGIPKYRKYPLRVPGNKAKTEELVSKAVQMFHYCNPNWKEELAKNIVKVIKSEKLSVVISRKSQILKHVKVSDIPKENLAS